MNLFKHLYTFVTAIAMGIGLLVALLFLLALILGGSTGSSLALFAGDLMSWAIILAAIAVLLGILHIYINREHRLKIDSED